MNSLRLFFFSLLLATSADAQTLTGLDKLYDDSQVARIDITIAPEALAYMYANPLSDSVHYASMHFQNAYINEAVDSIGFRIRGNTSRHAKKKSFKISVNEYISGREFYTVDKLNLNGEHNDPSIIRAKLSFDLFRSAGIKASRASHTEVYINGVYYGLYISVEHIDDEFLKKKFRDDSGNLWKCLYGADLVYLGQNQQTYKNLNNNGTPAYELTTNEETGDFSQLVRLISNLTNTSWTVFPDSIEKLMDIKTVLQYMAINTLIGGWDDYWSLMNNYYLYYEPASDKFTFIPYDYDNTFGVDWSGHNWRTANPYNKPKVVGGARPLVEKILAIPQYRNLYSHFLHFYKDNLLTGINWSLRVDSLRGRITASALADSFRTLDYGFTSGDFFNSYNSSPYSNQHVKTGIKQFVNERNASLPAQINYQSGPPIIYDINIPVINPGPNDSIPVYVSAYSHNGLMELSVRLVKDGTVQELKYPMLHKPVQGTKICEENDRYYVLLPPLGMVSGAELRIYVKNLSSTALYYPRNNPIRINVQGVSNIPLKINEFMADNGGSVPDPDGEADDWLEIYNNSGQRVSLAGMYLSDNPANLTKWRFPADTIYIEPFSHLVVWCDEDQGQAGYHTNFKLSKSGEFLSLTDSTGAAVIDSFSFGPQRTDTTFGRSPDASSYFTFMSPTPGMSNQITSVEDELLATNPDKYTLAAYPNPFNPQVNIQYNLAERALTSVKIFDVTGKLIDILENEVQDAGIYTILYTPDGNVSSGVLFIELRSGTKRILQKAVYLK